MNDKKKILILAPQFYPQKNGGGPTVSNLNLVKSIKENFDIYVISNNFELGETKPLESVHAGWNSFDFGNVNYVLYENNNFAHIYRLINSVKPDVIYQNSFFSHTMVLASLLYNKLHKVKMILAPRGELCANALGMKKGKKVLYIKLFKLFGMLKNVYFHTTGDDETNDVKKVLNVKKGFSYNIQNITLSDSEENKPLNKESGMLKLVFTARIQKKKNLLFAIKSLKNIRGDVHFDIYGPIEGADYWNECQDEMKKLPPNIKVEYCGQVEQSCIPETLRKYHIFYMPTLSENYGHSIVEAFLTAKPVIISDQTPWQNLSEHNCGYSLPLADEEGFETALQEFVDMDNDEYAKRCEAAQRYIVTTLNTDEIIKEYVRMFENAD